MKQGHILLEKPLNVPKQASLQPLVSADLLCLLPPFCFAQMYVNCAPKCFCLPDFSIKNDQKDAEFYPLVFLLSIDLAASELTWHFHRHQMRLKCRSRYLATLHFWPKQTFTSLKNWPLRPENKAKAYFVVGPVQMLTYSEGFGFLEAVALQILMFSWRLVSYDGEIHCVIVMKRALRTVAQIDLSPDDVTLLFAWRGSIGDTFCNHLASTLVASLWIIIQRRHCR